MEKECYVRYNSNINVNMIKVDSKITVPFQQAKIKKDSMESTTSLFNDFLGRPIVDANYISPESKVSGATFSIYKKIPNQKYYKYVCKLDNGNYLFYDYNITNNQLYHYLASVELKSSTGQYYYQTYENSENGEEHYFQSKFNEWSICNIEETEDPSVYRKFGDVWSLGLNLEGETVNQNLNITSWDTLGKYNRVSIGQKNSDSGTFSGLLGLMKEYTEYDFPEHGPATPDIYPNKQVYKYTEKIEHYDKNSDEWKVNGPTYEYSREVDKLNAWKKFSSDGELKLLRDLKGNAWIVQIVEVPSYSIDTLSNIQETRITFAWQEVKDVNSYSIIETGRE